MRTFATTASTYGVLAAAAAAAFLLPKNLLQSTSAVASTSSDVVRITGALRDFQSSSADFNVNYSGAPGQHTGLVSSTLGADGLPAYTGSGNIVTSPARDAAGNNIVPVLAHQNLGVNFSINNGQVVASEPFAAKITVLGAAMENPTAQIRITMRLRVGSNNTDPFGSFTASSGATGNIHDSNNPREYIVPGILAANTAISVTGRSWAKPNSSSSWSQLYEASSNPATQWVKVLRNGDSVPNIAPFGSQSSIQSFLVGYINTPTQKVTIADNQAIFLFELASPVLGATYEDYQDMVVLLTMAKSAAGLSQPPPPTACSPGNDTPATLGAASTGAITSPSSFSEWFSDKLGTNMSGAAGLDLVRQSNNNYVFDSSTDPYYSKLGGFYPADGQLYGEVAPSGHNEQFTFHFEAMFTYSALGNQFFETVADAEVWVFIDDKLVIDLSGFHGEMSQRIDLSRLCLNNNQEYKLSFFLAHRYAPQSRLRIETNLQFAGSPPLVAITGAFD